jgi:hypothetical protein
LFMKIGILVEVDCVKYDIRIKKSEYEVIEENGRRKYVQTSLSRITTRKL